MQLVQLSVLIGASPQHCALFCCLCNVCVALRKLGKNSILDLFAPCKSAFLVVQMYLKTPYNFYRVKYCRCSLFVVFPVVWK